MPPRAKEGSMLVSFSLAKSPEAGTMN